DQVVDEVSEVEEEDSLEKLIADLEAILEEEGVPGAGVAIVSGDDDIWVGGLGMADIEAGRVADEHTLFRIGSISKMFVSLSVLKLQEEGVLDLQDTLLEHAPEIPFENRWGKTDPIRLVHLLEHTTGFDDLHFNEYALADPDINLKDAYHFNPRSRNSRWRPGTFATYSNGNPPLAAYVVEQLKGVSFEDYVQGAFFDPLDMDTTSYFLTPEVESLLAKGYQGSKKNPTPVDYWHIIMRPSGSINASAREMSHLVRMFINRGVHEEKRLLSPESITRMETPTTTLAAKHGLQDGYGLNNYTKTHNGYYWHGHNGGMMGYVADLTYQPELGVGFVIMINRSSGALGQMSRRIWNYLMQEVETPDLPADIGLPPDHIEKHAGYYRRNTTRNQFTFGMERLPFVKVSPQEGFFKVTRTPGGSYNATPVEGGFYRHGKKWMATEAFFEDEDGKRYFQSGAFGSMEKVSGFSAWGQLVLAIFCVLAMFSSLILFPVYGIGWIIGKFREIDSWSLRLVPSAAIAFLILTIFINGYVMSDNQRLFDHFGQMTVLSALLYVFDWMVLLLGLFGLYKVVQAIRGRYRIHPVVKYYLLCVSLSTFIYLCYTLYWNPMVPIWLY
ncbi:MAG: serine hydrolase, partial [Cyanothece sp. SIO1E1]|nr:serine hydrolase [Cyanothece sp. SIO1E1]